MTSGPDLLTLEQFLALPEDPYWREEASRGEIVREPPPSHAHGTIVVRLTVLFAEYLQQNPVGQLSSNSGYLLQREPLTVRAPDLAFVRSDRLRGAYALATFFDGAPDLAVEVISPANSASDIQEKVDQYLAAGAAAVWVVYPRTRSVAAHHAGGEIRLYHSGETLAAGTLLPGFELAVDTIFD